MTIAAPEALGTRAKAAKALKAIHIGPTKLPRWSLGWQVAEWCGRYLVQPDGPHAGAPWDFTDEQLRFVVHWYAIDRHGRFVYRYGMLRRMKGWGKDPLAAALAAAEFLGPCRFAGWADGEPVAEAHYSACVQIAAVSQDQVKRNTMSLFPAMLSRRAIEEYGVDMGKEIIYAHHGRCRIELLTTSARSAEGPRATFIIKNETHHWVPSNGGPEMAAVVARNVAKSRDGAARVLAISNAHAVGEGSDAERDWEAWQEMQQRQGPCDFLYDSLEAPWPVDMEDEEAIRRALTLARGDSVWVDVDRLTAEVRDPRTSTAMARRFYFNQLAADEDRPFNRKRFEELARPAYKPAAGALITLGFDGSRKWDFTDLVATEVETGFQWIYGHWEPAPAADGEPWIDGNDVEEAVADAFKRYKVHVMYADPFWWGSEIARWEGRWGERIMKVPTNSYRRMAMAAANYRNAIETGALSHDGDPRLVAAVGNCHKHMHQFRDDAGEPMWTVQKERPDSPLKIDAAVAAILSWAAREAAIAEGALNKTGAADPWVIVV